MDPNACFARWLESITTLQTHDDAVEAHRDLKAWLQSGGFAPDWSETERLLFEAYHPGSGGFRMTLGQALPWLKVIA